MTIAKLPNFILITASICLSGYTTGVFLSSTFNLQPLIAFSIAICYSMIAHYYLIEAIKKLRCEKTISSISLTALLLVGLILYTDLHGVEKKAEQKINSTKSLTLLATDSLNNEKTKIIRLQSELISKQSEKYNWKREKSLINIKEHLATLQEQINITKSKAKEESELITKSETDKSKHQKGFTFFSILISSLISFRKQDKENISEAKAETFFVQPKEVQKNSPVGFQTIGTKKETKEERYLRKYQEVVQALRSGKKASEIRTLTGRSFDVIRKVKFILQTKN